MERAPNHPARNRGSVYPARWSWRTKQVQGQVRTRFCAECLFYLPPLPILPKAKREFLFFSAGKRSSILKFRRQQLRHGFRFPSGFVLAFLVAITSEGFYPWAER